VRPTELRASKRQAQSPLLACGQLTGRRGIRSGAQGTRGNAENTHREGAEPNRTDSAPSQRARVAGWMNSARRGTGPPQPW
jgi:hypothetical protein